MFDPNNKVVLVDGNNVMFATAFALKNAPNFDERFPRNLVSMIRKIKKAVGEYHPYVVAWDSEGASNWRRSIDDNYKRGRTHVDNLTEITTISKQIFDDMEFLSVAEKETEADDLIYAAAEVLTGRGKKVSIVSRDRDLLQTIQDGFAQEQYCPVSKKWIEVPPYKIVLYKALVGDSSDNIAGIKGIGDKTAKKMLREGTVLPWKAMEPFLDIVCIPRNPRYEEYKELMAQQLAIIR